MIDVYFYDKNLVRRGRLPVLSGSIVIRHNAVSTGVIDIDGNSSLWGRHELEGGHVAVYERGVQLIAGKLTKLERDKTGGLHDIQLHFSSHLSYVEGMITLPSPSRGLLSQTARSHYKESTNAETLIKNMVKSHVGQTARTENRSPMIVDSSEGRGKTVKINSRFRNLLDEAHELASAGGGLQFYTSLEKSKIRFHMRKPDDLHRSVRLREADGSVKKFSYSLEAPTATRVLVAGQGEKTDRMFRLIETPQTVWEVKTLLFQDRRDTDDPDDLVQAGEETLAEAGPVTSITIDTSMPGNRKYAHDFRVGDKISVQLSCKTNISDTLQRVELDWGATGISYTVSVGPHLEEPDENQVIETVRQLRRDLRGIQAK